MIVTRFIVGVMVGYLLGSIPFGLIVGKLNSRVDIRHYGSGRTGGTNVLRTLGRKAFVLVAIGDISKAALAVFMAGLIVQGERLAIGSMSLGIMAAQSLAGIAAILGHIWPVFAKFKGGRGVATFIGGLAAICPAAALFGGELLIIGAGLSGFASLGSITGAVGAYAIMIPMTLIYGFPLEYMIYVLIGSIIIILAHRDNIKRLLSGKERKLNQKAEAVSTSQSI
jgi:glycerol-3-phosphate acyltransferase PlsY